MQSDSSYDISGSAPTSWKYISEGGANIVLAYDPQDSASVDKRFIGKALRLRKKFRPPSEPPRDHLSRNDEVFLQEDDPHADAHALPASSEGPHEGDEGRLFTERVIAPLLGQEFLPESIPVVPPEPTFLSSLYEEIQRARPPNRKTTDELGIDDEKLVLVKDLTASDTLDPGKQEIVVAVEIKPKWSFIPHHAFLSEETRAIKLSHCRFCMHTAFKVKSKHPPGIEEVEHYCPLDLFSSDSNRVSRALKRLGNDWERTGGKGGFNNLKVFLDGRKLEPDEVFSNPKFISFLGLEGNQNKELVDSFAHRLSVPLVSSETPLLPRLKLLQSCFDPLDVEGLSARFARETGVSLADAAEVSSLTTRDDLHDNLQRAANILRKPTTAEWTKFVTKVADIGGVAAWALRAREENHAWKGEQIKAPTVTLRDLIMGYLLSASFKDCSIFVRAIKSSNGQIQYSLTAIDLDEKAATRLGKWEALDADIVKSFGSSSSKKKCVSQ